MNCEIVNVCRVIVFLAESVLIKQVEPKECPAPTPTTGNTTPGHQEALRRKRDASEQRWNGTGG